MLSAVNTIIVIKVWTVNDIVEEVAAATKLGASMVSVVETVEATMEAKSIEESMLESVTKVIDSIDDIVEVVNPQMVEAMTEVHDWERVDSTVAEALVGELAE